MTVTQLREGDYRPDGAGGFALATGGAGVLERVLFLLTARRGGFPIFHSLQRSPFDLRIAASSYQKFAENEMDKIANMDEMDGFIRHRRMRRARRRSDPRRRRRRCLRR